MTKKVAIIGADPVGSLEALLLVTLFDDLTIDVFDKKSGIYSQRPRTLRSDTIQYVIDTLTALKKAKLAEDDQFAADKIQTTIHFLQEHLLGLINGVTLSEQKICALLKKQALKLARINRKVLKAKKEMHGELAFYFNQEISLDVLTRMTSSRKHAPYEVIFAADGASSMARSKLFPDDIEHQPQGLNYKLEIKLKKFAATKPIHHTKPSIQDGMLHYWENESDNTTTLHIFINAALYGQFYAMENIVKQDYGQVATNRLANLPPTLQLFVMQQIQKVVGDKKFHADSLQMIAKPIYLQPCLDSSMELNASPVILVGSAELGLLLDDEDINLGFISAIEKAKAYYQTKAHGAKLGQRISHSLLNGYIIGAEINIEKQYDCSLKGVKHRLIGDAQNIESNIPAVWPFSGFDLIRLERSIEWIAVNHQQEPHKYADWLYQADKLVATLHKTRIDPLNEQKLKLRFNEIASATEFAQMIAGTIDNEQCKRQAKAEMYTNTFSRISDDSMPEIILKSMASLLMATQSLLTAEEVAHQFELAIDSLVKPSQAEIKQHLIALKTKMAAELSFTDPRQTIILQHFTTLTTKLTQGKLKSLSLEKELADLDAKLFGRLPLSSGLRAFIGFVLGAIAGFFVGLAVTAACSIAGPFAPVIGAAAGAAVFGSVGFFTKKSTMKKYEAKKRTALQQWSFAAELNAVKADFLGKLHQSHNSPKIRTR